MAMAARMDRRDYRVYVILGDGECDEGSVWEAALAASHHRLANLVVLIDYNKFQSYGRVSEVLELEPFADKWRSFGFRVQEVEMKEPEMLEKLLLDSSTEGSPLCVICHTVKGAGVSFMENNLAWHHKAKLTPEEKHLLTLELSEDEDKRNS
jgi:transketolase